MTWQQDRQFAEYTITRVEAGDAGYYLGFDSSGFFAPAVLNHKPQIGMKARLYGKGFGYRVRGLVIDGRVYYYRSIAEEEALQRQEALDYQESQRRKFKEDEPMLDAAYNDLPPEFKRRIDRFRKGNPDFRWRFEVYEMSCCTDAVNIATKLKTVEAINAWVELPHDQQRKQVEFFDGHSGNSFSCAVELARLWLTNAALVINAHGALTLVVGCDDYGCTHDD